MSCGHLHGARRADAAEVVAREVHEHEVLGPLLRVGEELLLQRRVLRGVAPRRRVPASGRMAAVPSRTFTCTSGEAPKSWKSPKSR